MENHFLSARGLGHPETGWPKRSTLEAMDMGFVADALEAAGRLGRDVS
jgi:hypothetical protein